MDLIAKKAQIGLNCSIADTAVIEDDVVIGDNCIISDFVVIRNGTRIGNNNKIYSHVAIGEDPQDKSFQAESSFVEIGDNNILREFVTIHKAVGLSQSTILGDDNFLMVGAHVGHNAKLANNITMANNSTIGGYVEIADHVNISSGTALHQHCRMGAYSMLGGLSAINHDALPYTIYLGVPAGAISTNRHAMKKAGFDQAVRSEIMRAYKLVYGNDRKSLPNIVNELKSLEQFDEIKNIIDFIESSKRGIIMGKFNPRNERRE